MTERVPHSLARLVATAAVAGAVACSESDPVAPDELALNAMPAHGLAALAAIEDLLPALEDESLQSELTLELGDAPRLIRNAHFDELRGAVLRSRRTVKDAVAFEPNGADPVLAAVELILDYSAREGVR